MIFSQKHGAIASRTVPEKLSNGDENEIAISVKNNYSFNSKFSIIDEIPIQFQIRDFNIQTELKNGETKTFSYSLKPVRRGEYIFGNLNVYATCTIGFLSKRYVFDKHKTVAVYPSFLQMKKYEFLAISNRLTDYGIKKIRSIGRHSEFDQIRQYTTDDDFRNINWKATARRTEIMVNQYQEEKSQHVYNIIDMGRVMKMPFEGMMLLDHSINAALVLASIAMQKQDKTGLITFSTKIDTFIKADKKNNQTLKIMESLYKQETRFEESNLELLYSNIKRNISQRSLLLLYTNFESISALKRQLNFLQLIAKQHVLVVIFFINTEIQKTTQKNAENLEDIYIKTIAEKMIFEKEQILKTLHKNGIHAILTDPKELTVNTINKYLEIKTIGF